MADTTIDPGAEGAAGRPAPEAGDTTTTPDAPQDRDTGAGAAAEDAAEAGEELSAEDLRAALAAARREAARYRVEARELRPLAEAARAAEEAGKSEAERAAERIAALEAENHALALSAARDKVAAESGITAEVLRGDCPEELAEHATAVKSLVEQAVAEALAAAVPYAPVVPGENAGGSPPAESDWLRATLRGR